MLDQAATTAVDRAEERLTDKIEDLRSNLSESAKKALREATEAHVVPALVAKQDELISKREAASEAGESTWQLDAAVAGIGLLLTLLLGKDGYSAIKRRRANGNKV